MNSLEYYSCILWHWRQVLSCPSLADFPCCRTNASHQAARLPLGDSTNQTARASLADVLTHINRPKQMPLNSYAAKAARLPYSVMSNTSAGDSGQFLNRQEGLITDSNMAIAVQHSHATTACDWPSVKLTAAPSHSPASLASPKADEATSELPAAASMHSLAAKPLPTSHVEARMAATAAAVDSEPTAASTSGCTAADSESQHAAAESESQHAAAEAASSLPTAAATVIKPHSAAARSAAETDNSQPAGSKVGQMGLPLTTTLMQAELPLVKALVQSSGTGCEDVLQMSKERLAVGKVRARDSWVSHSFRGKAQSSCTLQLLHKTQHGVSIKVWAWIDSC